MTTESQTHGIYSSAVIGMEDTAQPTHFTKLLARAASWLLTCGERHRQRIMLASFDDRALADLGLSRGDVSSEIEKWPWKA